MTRLLDSLRRTDRAVWFAIGLTWLVTALLVVWGARAMREQVHAQIIGRDAVLLQAMARAVRAADVDDLIGPDDPLWVLLRMEHLEGVLAARLFDATGKLIVCLPHSVREDEVPAWAWEPLKRLQPLTEFHRSFALSRVLLATNTEDLVAWSKPRPVIEAFVPFQRRSDGHFDGVAWFLLDGRVVAAEFARFDRNLWSRAGMILLVALGITGAALGWAFHRISRSNRLLARRTEDLQRANTELAQSARVAALGAVTAHLMHGLKSPVSGLHSFVASRGQWESIGEDAWVDALDATRRMQALIAQVVRVLEDQGSDLDYEVTLRDVGEAVLQRARPLAEKNHVRLGLEGEPTGWVDNRTASLLTLLLSNLVENGIEATPAGKAVRLRFPRGAPDLCEVIDEGSGLSPDVRQRLFQPQRSTKEGGSGLGLAISRQLASALGGSIQLVATGSAGTVFRVELPRANSAESLREGTSYPFAEHG